MKKSYLFVFSAEVGSSEEVMRFLDQMPQVEYWRQELPNSFFFISTESAHVLANIMRALCRDKGLYIITEITAVNKQGWLTQECWDIINQKKVPEKPKLLPNLKNVELQ